MKTSKITKVQSTGTFKNDHGLFYSWEVEFENGDMGAANTKDLEHKTWLEGQVVNYELTPNANPKFLGKLKLVKDVAQNTSVSGSNSGLNVQNLIVAQSCISSACTLHQQSMEGNAEQVLQTAQKFYDWVIKKG